MRSRNIELERATVKGRLPVPEGHADEIVFIETTFVEDPVFAWRTPDGAVGPDWGNRRNEGYVEGAEWVSVGPRTHVSRRWQWNCPCGAYGLFRHETEAEARRSLLAHHSRVRRAIREYGSYDYRKGMWS